MGIRTLRVCVVDRYHGASPRYVVLSQIDADEWTPRWGEWGGCGFDGWVEAMLFAAAKARRFVHEPDWTVSVEFVLKDEEVEFFLDGGCLGPRLQ
jgi:hypothetical protein